MCRYSMHPAKSHWACLPCRHTAKFSRYAEPVCPRCQTLMVNLGRDFKAPRRADKAQWDKVGRLVSVGAVFDSCGCGGPGYRPKSLSDAKTELRQRRTDCKVWAPRRLRLNQQRVRRCRAGVEYGRYFHGLEC